MGPEAETYTPPAPEITQFAETAINGQEDIRDKHDVLVNHTLFLASTPADIYFVHLARPFLNGAGVSCVLAQGNLGNTRGVPSLSNNTFYLERENSSKRDGNLEAFVAKAGITTYLVRTNNPEDYAHELMNCVIPHAESSARRQFSRFVVGDGSGGLLSRPSSSHVQPNNPHFTFTATRYIEDILHRVENRAATISGIPWDTMVFMPGVGLASGRQDIVLGAAGAVTHDLGPLLPAFRQKLASDNLPSNLPGLFSESLSRAALRAGVTGYALPEGFKETIRPSRNSSRLLKVQTMGSAKLREALAEPQKAPRK